jgi:hypothetical protein
MKVADEELKKLKAAWDAAETAKNAADATWESAYDAAWAAAAAAKDAKDAYHTAKGRS